MCAAATELQTWWRSPPWIVEGKIFGGFPTQTLYSNIEIGDFFHHGKLPCRPNNPENQQVSIISNKILHVGSEIPASFFSYEIGWQRGRHFYEQKHYPDVYYAEDCPEKHKPTNEGFRDGWWLWLPKLNQIISHLSDERYKRYENYIQRLDARSKVMNLVCNLESIVPNAYADAMPRTMEQLAITAYQYDAFRKRWDEESSSWR